MSEFATTYTTFDVYDFTNQKSLSTYALSATPLKFIPELTDAFAHKVVWSFGDGSTSNQLSAIKHYDFPGQYVVNLVVYDCYDNAQISVFSQIITIVDYTTFTFTISANDDPIPNGKIHGPWAIKAYYPPYQPPSNIFYTVSGSNSSYYFNTSANKFSHLENTYSVYQTLSNVALSANQYQEIDRISIPTTTLYSKISGSTIIPTTSNDPNGFIVGLSGQKEVYFKDDSVSNRINIDFFFDKTNNYILTNYHTGIAPYFNNLNVALSAEIVPNTDVNSFSITSNGIDGEGTHITSFDIAPIKFEDIKIPFVIKIKDSDSYSVKNFTPLALSSFSSIYVLSGNNPLPTTYYTISSLNSTLSGQTHYGSFRGYIQFTLPDRTPLSGVSIVVDNTTVTNNQSNTFNISGSSALFDVYPKDYYNIYKINEDLDGSQMFKDLIFQESMTDKPVLFDDFLGSIFGTLSSSYESLGRKIYEKIANFVANTQDIDRCELFALLSNMELLGADVNIYDSTLFNYPEIVKRILNFASINKNKLFGTTNKFDQNFDPKGRSSKIEYGRNLGDVIDTNTYIISAGIPIVALEKFSGDYTLLNTMQPLSALSGAITYQLSSYDRDWGWPLVLPSDFAYIDFDKYYYFFEYVPGYDGTITNNTIDFTNPLTTVAQSATQFDLMSNNGIFVNMISDALYSSLDLYVD